MKKRLCSLGLALVLALSLLLTPALAAATAITVTSPAPVAGEEPSAAGITMQNSATGRTVTVNPRLDSAAWYEAGTGRALSEGERFKAGADYCLGFLLGSTDYENFVTFQQGHAPDLRCAAPMCYNVKTRDIGVRAGRAVVRVELYYHTARYFSAEDSPYGPAGVIGAEAIRAGDHPNTGLAAAHPDSYRVTGVKWYPTGQASRPLAADSVFQAGTRYTLEFTLNALDGTCIFQKDLAIQAGGLPCAVEVRSAGEAVGRIELTPQAAIEAVSVDGIQTPAAGAEPQTEGFTAGPETTAVFRGWEGDLDRDGLFRAGETYTLWLSLLPQDGQTFAGGGSLRPENCGVNAGTVAAVAAGWQEDGGEYPTLGIRFTIPAPETREDLGDVTFDLTEGSCRVTDQTGDRQAALDATLALLEREGKLTVSARGWTLMGSETPDVLVERDRETMTLQAAPETAGRGEVVLSPEKNTVGEFLPAGSAYFSSVTVRFPRGEACRITFDANGGGGEMAAVQAEKGARYVLPACGFSAPAGKTFDKWDLGPAGTAVTLDGDAVLTAQWKDGETRTTPFVDVSENDYFYGPVNWAFFSDPQITVGVDGTHFGPDQTVTRGQCVTFLWRAMGCPAPTLAENPFQDVRNTEYWYQAILWAVENGITVGTDANHFSPSQTLSTHHIVTFLFRTMNPGRNGWDGAAEAWARENDPRGTALPFGVDIPISDLTPCPRQDVVTFLYQATQG